MANKIVVMSIIIIVFGLGLMWFNSIPNWIMENSDYAVMIVVTLFFTFIYAITETIKN